VRHVVIHRAGGYERLRVEDADDPRATGDGVVVRTHAVGVNYADCVVRMGLYRSAREFVGWPITPGFEFAGTVASLGPDVRDLAVGDRVFGVTLFGGYATHVRVPRHQLFAIPPAFSDADAAAFPAVFLTAWYALHELARPRRPATVLVHSAAGGVGGALVQLARIAGLGVVGVVGASHKVDAVRAFGAEHVIDKSHASLWREAERISPRGFDVVFDANGVSTLRASYRHLASPGRLVVYGFHSMLPRTGGKPNYVRLARDFVLTPRFDPLSLTNDNRSVMAFNLSYLFERRDILAEAMTELLAHVAAGRIVPPRITEFPLERVADAHRALESGQTVGKLVLRTGS
jgi:NADPH:quinone reductase-like Zn-dependent oxidoreductase